MKKRWQILQQWLKQVHDRRLVAGYLAVSISWLAFWQVTAQVFSQESSVLPSLAVWLWLALTAAFFYEWQRQSRHLFRQETAARQTAEAKLAETEEKLAAQINELLACKEAVTEQMECWQALLGAIPDLVLLFDGAGRYVECNALYGNGGQKDAVGSSLYDILPAPIVADFLAGRQAALTSGSAQTIEYCLPQGNQLCYFEARLMPLLRDSVLAIVRDISEVRRLLAELKALSSRDALTGLYNRMFFEQTLAELDTAAAAPLSVFMIDLNRFKEINDTQGHQAGDYYLQEAAKLLGCVFRPDDVVVRMGGDEFAVLQLGCDETMAQTYYERLKEYERAYRLAHPEAALSMAVGFASTADGSMDIQTLLKAADERMYAEKEICHGCEG